MERSVRGFSPKRLLDERGLRPRKRFSQNFLVDPRFAARMARALPENAYVIEIGGGTGSLTEALVRRARTVVVLEIDRDLAAVLHERFQLAVPRLVVRCEDALRFDVRAALEAERRPRAICGNLPYSITTPLLERIFACSSVFESSVVMVQREYADRLCASPGTPAYGSLSLYAAHYCTIEKLLEIGAAGFYPQPGVGSAVVRLTPRPNSDKKVRDEGLLFALIRSAFAQRRKTLVNSVSGSQQHAGKYDRAALLAALQRLGIDTAARAETLTLDDFYRLADALSEAGFALSR